MSRTLIFLPEVAADFDDAFNYYESLSPGWGGKRFDNAFRGAVEEVRNDLITHRKIFGRYHRVFLRRFPYNLYYALAEERAFIVGVLCYRFDPDKIEEILRGRGGPST